MNRDPIKGGARVYFAQGGEWHHGRMHADGRVVAAVEPIGSPGVVIGVRALDVLPVCGVCPDCAALNALPGCLPPEAFA